MYWQLANWQKSARKVGGHFNRWLVIPETWVIQIGQLVANLTDQLVVGNPALV